MVAIIMLVHWVAAVAEVMADKAWLVQMEQQEQQILEVVVEQVAPKVQVAVVLVVLGSLYLDFQQINIQAQQQAHPQLQQAVMILSLPLIVQGVIQHE
jgi:hypothetical protein